MAENHEVYSKEAVDQMFLHMAEMHAMSLGMMIGLQVHSGAMTEAVAAWRLREVAKGASSPVVAVNFLAVADAIEAGKGPRFEVIDGGKVD